MSIKHTRYSRIRRKGELSGLPESVAKALEDSGVKSVAEIVEAESLRRGAMRSIGNLADVGHGILVDWLQGKGITIPPYRQKDCPEMQNTTRLGGDSL